MRRRLARTRNLMAVIIGVLAGAGAQSLGQQVNPESSHQLSQSAQATAVERPGGMAAQWMKVPEVNITPGGVNTRPNIENPLANDPSSVERGMKYFTQFNCVGCHAPNGGGG